MSIPPLVCNSPPPPDQCEEDKDQDDFDISYGLSQDDDDDAYNYGDFSSFNHFQSKSIPHKSEPLSINIVPIIPCDTKEVNDIDHITTKQPENKLKNDNISCGTITVNEIKAKCDEDTNIEDLGLEINEESLSSNDKEDDNKSELVNDNVETSKVLETDDVSDENITQSSSGDENVVGASNVNDLKEILDDPVDDLSVDLEPLPSEPISSNDELSKHEDIKEVSDVNVTETEPNLDDDFGDYDDFQFVSTETKPSGVIENCANPWDSSEIAEDNDFGNFTANFDTHETQIRTDSQSADIEKVIKDDLNVKSATIDEDDDFGDFDDFKSSAIEKGSGINSEELETNENMSVLNFHTSDNEHQVIESITKVLNSIFEEEISEPETEFEGTLESTLSETWRHLRETDVRQPYIVNWNNSLGQKTLLKALCIDSRNILFGPKWSYNMPKYAVNLTAAPLQPQKPAASSNPPQTEAVKTTTKPGGWTDPFTADGQEFTYAEALLLDLEHLMATLDQMAHNHSTLKISELLSHACNTESESVVEVTASDLDVFEAAITRKPEKIYSSTLNVQPLRQISLPDTHIFTPTDSETPTSKTVHYNSGPPILLPQTALESSNISESTEPANTAPDINKDDDDYWEFQDFKSGSEKNSTTITSIPPLETEEPKKSTTETKIDNTAKPNVTYQTQVLEPIKMEPLMPTVNWPDPGEIKETFDDFSDFVSNSSWNDKSQPRGSSSQTENNVAFEFKTLDNTNSRHKDHDVDKDRTPIESHKNLDDEFDTFQSALPTKHITPESNFDSLSSDTFNNIPQEHSLQMTDFTTAFPNINNVKPENISANTLTRPSQGLTPYTNLSFPSNTPEMTPFRASGSAENTSHNNLLQPTSTNSNSSQNQQKTAQILQPLSLESYSQINWPNPGIDLQDLSRFNPVESLQSLKSDINAAGPSKVSSPVHGQKNTVNNQVSDDDWGEFVSSKPKQQTTISKKPPSFVDDDEWTDFVSSPSVKPQNGLNTISLNVHTNSNIQKTGNMNKLPTKNNQMPLDIPTLNYITPKTSGGKSYTDRHFQNL